MCDTDLMEKRKSPSKKQTPKKTKTNAAEGGQCVFVADNTVRTDPGKS